MVNLTVETHGKTDRKWRAASLRWLLAATIAVCFLEATRGGSFAGGGPENAIVVVNDDSPSSKLIANHYVRLRNIPARNVIHLTGIPDRETTDLTTFKKKILVPILVQLKARNIQKSVDYILYSADFPTSIAVLNHKNKLFSQIRAKAGAPKNAKIPNGNLYHGHASINALTYFSVAVLANEPAYMTLDSNSYYRVAASKILAEPFSGQQQQIYENAVAAFDGGSGQRFDDAIVQLQRLAERNPGQAAVSYWLAKFYAVRGDVKASVKWLTQAIQNGWVYRETTKKDDAFENVRINPLFRGLEDRIPDQPFDFAPTRGFKHSRRWSLNGMVNQENGQGNNLFLSTVLAVTRNFGTTEQEALDQLTASVSADETDPLGTFYFSVGGGVRNKTRKSQIKPVVKALRALGKKATTVEENFPTGAQDVAGLMTGTAKFRLADSGIKILPGAICDHLTSFGGRLAVPNQTKLSEFIRYGAAGASGTVTEPYAIAAKFPHAMIHVHYARGCSLAESFYQSVSGPFQLLVVGDALCQPYANRPKLTVGGLLPMQEVSGEVSLTFDAEESKSPISMMEVYVDGILFYRGHDLKPLKFDSNVLADGYHEIRAVVTNNDLIESNGHDIVPFFINNKGHAIKAFTARKSWDEGEQVEIEVTSNFGDSLAIIQNMRSVAEPKKVPDGDRSVVFKIPAKVLGRGPVEVQAIASDAKGTVIGSQPLQLNVDGVISSKRRNTERPKPKPPKASPVAANISAQLIPW